MMVGRVTGAGCGGDSAERIQETTMHTTMHTTISVADAITRVKALLNEVRRLRLRIWEIEWPVGHAERDQHRPDVDAISGPRLDCAPSKPTG